MSDGAEVAAELVVVGGGRAGLSAAVEARAQGLTVLVLDEAPAPGWGHGSGREAGRGTGDALLRAFADSGADFAGAATFRRAEPADGGLVVGWKQDGVERHARAARLLLAPGAVERPLPIPGWTLPGVMTVGAAQTALTTAGLLPQPDSWVAGHGPLLRQFVHRTLEAGGFLAGVLDLAQAPAWRQAPRLLPRMAAHPDVGRLLGRMASWKRAAVRAGVPWRRVSGLSADGVRTLAEVSFRAAGGQEQRPASLLLLHDGFIPSVGLSRALGCAHRWDTAQRCWVPAADEWGATSREGVLVAGDAGGIKGVLDDGMAAGASGRLVALGAAYALGRIDAATRDAAATPLRAVLARQVAVRAAMQAAFPPLVLAPADATLVCRCAEVTAGALREAGDEGRCTHGACGGRICAGMAAEVLARARGVAPAEVGIG